MKKILFYLLLPFFLPPYVLYLLIKNNVPSVRARRTAIISAIFGTLAKNGKTEEADLWQMVSEDTKLIITQNEFVSILRTLARSAYVTHSYEICTCESCKFMLVNFHCCTMLSYWEITRSGRKRRSELLKEEQEEAYGGLLPSPA